jgi:paired small multidrug resistance pump
MSMHIAWYDVVGTVGVVLILIAYFLLQTERWSGQSLRYSLVNLVGSLMITVSLIYDFNLSSFIIEVAWIAISIYGMVRARRATRVGASYTPSEDLP